MYTCYAAMLLASGFFPFLHKVSELLMHYFTLTFLTGDQVEKIFTGRPASL